MHICKIVIKKKKKKKKKKCSVDSNVHGCLQVFSMQDEVSIVSELPRFVREGGHDIRAKVVYTKS